MYNRENCRKVAAENEKLHDTLYQAERDTIEVITYLKKEDLIKDEQVKKAGANYHLLIRSFVKDCSIKPTYSRCEKRNQFRKRRDGKMMLFIFINL